MKPSLLAHSLFPQHSVTSQLMNSHNSNPDRRVAVYGLTTSPGPPISQPTPTQKSFKSSESLLELRHLGGLSSAWTCCALCVLMQPSLHRDAQNWVIRWSVRLAQRASLLPRFALWRSEDEDVSSGGKRGKRRKIAVSARILDIRNIHYSVAFQLSHQSPARSSPSPALMLLNVDASSSKRTPHQNRLLANPTIFLQPYDFSLLASPPSASRKSAS